MARENPWFGVGFDSYGDFYRLYRDESAILRTGPQRVTNTAHNIFLDVGSGAGLIALLLFLMIFGVTLYIIFSAFSKNSFDEDSIFWSALFIGFIVFCSISINQIGVGIWGFIAMGLVIGSARTSVGSEEKLEDQRSSFSSKKKPGPSKGRVNTVFKGNNKSQSRIYILGATQISIALIVSIFAGQQARVDISLREAIRNRDLDVAYKISFSSTAQDQHREITFARLAELGRGQDALRLAMRTTHLNERNWQGWVFIISSELSSYEEKREAALKLLELDPKNSLVKQEVLPLIR